MSVPNRDDYDSYDGYVDALEDALEDAIAAKEAAEAKCAVYQRGMSDLGICIERVRQDVQAQWPDDTNHKPEYQGPRRHMSSLIRCFEDLKEGPDEAAAALLRDAKIADKAREVWNLRECVDEGSSSPTTEANLTVAEQELDKLVRASLPAEEVG